MMLEEFFIFDIDPRQMFSTTGRLRLAISVPNKYKEKLVEDEQYFSEISAHTILARLYNIFPPLLAVLN